MQKYVLGFAFNEAITQVILIQKKKPEWQKGLLNGVGGKIEKDENPYQAMHREFKEETGIHSTGCVFWNYFEMSAAAKMWAKDLDAWNVQVYYTQLIDEEFYSAYSATPEKIIIAPLHELHLLPTISNLQWLIPMAVDKLKGTFNYQANLK